MTPLFMDRARVVFGVLLCAGAFAACGARTLAGDVGDGGARATATNTRGGSSSPEARSGGGGGNEPTEDASGPTFFDVCPPHAPQLGTECSSPNLGCAYYDETPRSCQAFFCNSAGIWQPGPQGC
jgi:hypothetical protein